MPRVPQYETVVDRKPLPGARLDTVASPELFTAGPRQAAGVLEGADRALAGSSKILQDMQDREDVDKTFRADTQLAERALAFELAQKQKTGEKAVDLLKQTEEFYTKAAGEIGNTLTNPRQKKLFEQSAAKRRLQTVDSMSTHEAEQKRASVAEAALARAKISTSTGAANAFNDRVVGESKQVGVDSLTAVARGNGKPKEAVDALALEYTTNFHKQIIEARLSAGEPQSARAYFEEYKKEVDGSALDDFEDMFKRHAAAGKAASSASIEAAQRAAVDQAHQAFADSGYKMMPDLATRKAMGKDRTAFEKYANDTIAGLHTPTDWTKYPGIRAALLADPQGYHLTAQYPFLSTGDREQLHALQESARKGATADVYSVEQQMAATLAPLAWDGEKTGAFKSRTTNQIYAEQRNKGKPLTQKERQDVIDRMLIEGEVASGSWFKADKNARVYELGTPAERAAFVPEISDDERALIVDAIEADKKEATEEEIVRRFKLKNGLP